VVEQKALINWCNPDFRARSGPNAYLYDSTCQAYRGYESRRIPCPQCERGVLNTDYGNALECQHYACEARVARDSLPLAPGERLWIDDFTPYVVRPRD
jgi:hypothetical protein